MGAAEKIQIEDQITEAELVESTDKLILKRLDDIQATLEDFQETAMRLRPDLKSRHELAVRQIHVVNNLLFSVMGLLEQEEEILSGDKELPIRLCNTCDGPFRGRSNRRYCTDECQKDAERMRAKFRQLLARQLPYIEAEAEALAVPNYHDVRLIREQRKRDARDICKLLGEAAIQTSPGLIHEFDMMDVRVKRYILSNSGEYDGSWMTE